ncbi:MAG: PepSY-associated TM helix domain-containing protein, partial [Planctomyces sp.]
MSASSWPDYRAVWRWHFYAGLICVPFVIILSLTGCVYLFRPQIEAWTERSYNSLSPATSPLPPAKLIDSALQAFPGSVFSSYELPANTQSAARVVVATDSGSQRVYVHPGTGVVLGSIPEDQRIMRLFFRLHGELLMGDRGSNIVETAACWTVVLLLSGIWLWWPRSARGLAGVLYPRLFAGSRLFWRDLHAVVGLWITGLALFLLLTGLPWAKFWGDYFKTVRQITGTAVARQDWSNTAERRPADAAKAAAG